VLLGEPSQTPYDLKFSLFGIPVRVHPLFWLAGLLVGPHNVEAPRVLIWMVAFFLGILCHELGHAMVMRGQGCFSWITLYGFGGLASCDRRRGFGGRNSESLREIAVSAAGPLAGFLLAAIVVAAVVASKHEIIFRWGAPYGLKVGTPDVIGNSQVTFFINSLLFVTVVYGILNLVPVLPLDGGQIARELLMMIFGADGVRLSLILSMFVAGCLAVYGGVKLRDPFIAIFFGIFAYSSFATLQAYNSNRPW
jgi:stage IV sporulation protein FB